MQEPAGSRQASARTERVPPSTVKAGVDPYPSGTTESWRTFAALPAEDRAAAYLRSIRTMLLFFTVITVVGLAAAIVVGVMVLNAVHSAGSTPTNPFG